MQNNIAPIFKPLSIETKPLNEAQQILQHISTMGNDNSKQEQRWEELDNIYVNCAKALSGPATEVNNAYRIPGIFNFVDSPVNVKTSLLSLANDIKTLAAELALIKETHKGKTGLIKNAEDTQLSIGVFEQYFNFQQKFNGIILPTIMILAEEAGKAANKMQQAVDLANQQNPDVITDVTPKD
jgi:hypothetical protein